MIKNIVNGKLYSKSALFSYLEHNNFSKEKIEELYKIYSSERNDIKIKESKILSKKDIEKILSIAENLLKEIKALFK